MFKLYGKNPRCLWCAKADMKDYQEITLNIKYARPARENALVCSAECERKTLDTCRFIEKSMPIFLPLFVIGVIAGISGEILVPVYGKAMLSVSAGGIMLLGITFMVFPFVTPQTVKIFGLKKGMILGKIGGIILFLAGYLLADKLGDNVLRTIGLILFGLSAGALHFVWRLKNEKNCYRNR